MIAVKSGRTGPLFPSTVTRMNPGPTWHYLLIPQMIIRETSTTEELTVL